MTDLDTFCRQVRARSAEHKHAIYALRAMPGQVVSVLRQELDSLVRVVFLLAQGDHEYRQQLLADVVSGRKWFHKSKEGKKKVVTDRDMVELTHRLHGWTRSVYGFGCAFIHLSSFHDYRTRDPLAQISDEERDFIIRHLRHYHGGPHTAHPTFEDIVPMLPCVFTKVADNLECYVKQLERGEPLDD